ncbi:MAG: hypothetical protein QM758_21620 [Armatimonas sp.]
MEIEKRMELRLRHISPREVALRLRSIDATEGIQTLQVDEDRGRLTVAGSEDSLARVRQLTQLMDKAPVNLKVDVFRVRYTPGLKGMQRTVLSTARLRATTERTEEVDLVAEGKSCRVALQLHRRSDNTLHVQSYITETRVVAIESERTVSLNKRGLVGTRQLPRKRLFPLHVLDHRGTEASVAGDAQYVKWWAQGGSPPQNETVEVVEVIVG